MVTGTHGDAAKAGKRDGEAAGFRQEEESPAAAQKAQQEEAARQKLHEEAARSAEAHRRAAELEAAYQLELWKQHEQVGEHNKYNLYALSGHACDCQSTLA